MAHIPQRLLQVGCTPSRFPPARLSPIPIPLEPTASFAAMEAPQLFEKQSPCQTVAPAESGLTTVPTTPQQNSGARSSVTRQATTLFTSSAPLYMTPYLLRLATMGNS